MTRKLAALMIAALAVTLVVPSMAPAQKAPGRVPVGGGGGGGGFRGGGLIGLGVGLATGVIASQPPADARTPDEPKPKRHASRNAKSGGGGAGGGGGGSGVPPAGERRMVPDEVVITLSNNASPQTINAIRTRHRLTQLDSQQIALLNSTVYRWRIPDRRSVATVVRALEGDNRVASAQPNYLFALQQTPAEAKTDPTAALPPRYGDPAQYALAKMRLQDAHRIAKGGEIRVAVIDSGVDPEQPELAGALAGSFDTLKSPFAPHSHGTAIAALIAAHSRLMGSAPEARILGVRAFDPSGDGAEATTFNIVRGLDWSVAQNARIINMSFAGPADPMIHRALEAANKKGVVLIAAAGNAGEKSPPLYPAAEPTVIAVGATDSSDNVFKASNRGRHIALTAPGVDILVAVPNGGYEISSGTSYSAAEVSGIAALMLQRKTDLAPAAVREVLLKTAKDLGKKGRDDDFGAGLIDAYRAVTELPGAQVTNALPPK